MTGSIAFESRIGSAGYRQVLVRVALLRLRWVLAIAAFFAFSALGRGDTGRALLWVGMSAGALLVVTGYALWASGSPSADHSIYAPVNYAVDAEGMSYTTPTGEGHVAWDQIRRWQSVADHYLLYVGSASYLLVSGASLDEAGARDDFETLVREHVPHGPWSARRAG